MVLATVALPLPLVGEDGEVDWYTLGNILTARMIEEVCNPPNKISALLCGAGVCCRCSMVLLLMSNTENLALHLLWTLTGSVLIVLQLLKYSSAVIIQVFI